MDISSFSTKDIGNLGEKVAEEYFRRHGFEIIDRNIARKTGEIDLIVKKGGTLHFVEVKSLLSREFPDPDGVRNEYSPADNLHPYKIRKVARTAEWYVAEKEWEGEWQIDAALIWLRERDGRARVEYLPQIV